MVVGAGEEVYVNLSKNKMKGMNDMYTQDKIPGITQDNMKSNPLKGWDNIQEISTYVEMEKRLYRMYSYGLSCDIRVETKYHGDGLEDYMDVILVDKKDYIEEGIRIRIGDYFTVMSEVIESHLNEIEGKDWIV